VGVVGVGISRQSDAAEPRTTSVTTSKYRVPNSIEIVPSWRLEKEAKLIKKSYNGQSKLTSDQMKRKEKKR